MKEDFIDALWFWPVFLAELLDLVVRTDWSERLVLRIERRAGL